MTWFQDINEQACPWYSKDPSLIIPNTQQLLNNIVGVQANFPVSYSIRVISRVKWTEYIGKVVLTGHLGSKPDPCYIQISVIMNRVTKSFIYTMKGGDFNTYALPSDPANYYIVVNYIWSNQNKV